MGTELRHASEWTIFLLYNDVAAFTLGLLAITRNEDCNLVDSRAVVSTFVGSGLGRIGKEKVEVERSTAAHGLSLLDALACRLEELGVRIVLEHGGLEAGEDGLREGVLLVVMKAILDLFLWVVWTGDVELSEGGDVARNW